MSKAKSPSPISFIFVLLTIFSIEKVNAQRIYSVAFSKLPQDYQLYPRDSTNQAVVPISGIIEAAGYKYMSVQVFRNEDSTQYLKADITYNSKGIGSFAVETKIKAELAEYGFKVYACKSDDSVLVVHRKNVVSGDAYILTGQSNSTGFFTESETSEYCRTFGKITKNLNTDPYNAADTLWALSNQNNYETGVGTMGLEIQKQLSEKSGIPNCLINAGFHWSTAASHAHRNENNPADFSNGYGRMIYRVQKAGLTNAIQTFIFRQGESEAYHEGFKWEENFKILYSNSKLDLPNLKKLYVFQIDIIYYPSDVGAQLRDYQRRLPEIYSDVQSIASIGTKEFDGLHYGREGNKQSGFELSRMILRDFYQLEDTLNINSPSLKKAFFLSEEKKQLVLVFDEGQEMVYPIPYKPNAGITLDIKELIYLNEFAKVLSGKVEKNRIILEMNGSLKANMMSYLPSYLPEGGSYYPFTGPYFTNKLGMRAFTFYNVNISDALPIPVLTSALSANGGVILNWEGIKDANGYILERKISGENDYRVIARLDSLSRKFEDSVDDGQTVSYRLKATSNQSESADFAYTEIEVPLILGVPVESSDLFSVFPNPAPKRQKVTIRFKTPVTGSFELINSGGQSITKQMLYKQTEKELILPDLPSAGYFIRFKSENKTWSKTVLVH